LKKHDRYCPRDRVTALRRSDAYRTDIHWDLIILKEKERIPFMLYTIAVILIILWILGIVSSTTMGGFIHILLVIAVISVLYRIISGRNPV
jgi:hypothetical protein